MRLTDSVRDPAVVPGWTDAAFMAAQTSGFDALQATVRDYTPERVAQTCGISTIDLLQATRLFAGIAPGHEGPRSPTLSLYCQGLNQSSSGAAKNAALINLHLACGQIGKPGAGPFSLTGQPNAMGGREVGGMANLLSGDRDLANPVHRAEVAAPWGVAEVPATPAKTADHLLAAREELQSLMARFPFASCVPFSNNTPLDTPQLERSGLLFRAASHEAPAEELLLQIETLLNLDGPHILRYLDKKHGQRRAVHLLRGDVDTTLEGFLLAGDTRAQRWISTVLQDELPAQAYGRALLVPGAKAPVQVVSRGQQVCACFNVTDVAITAHLTSCPGSDEERLASLQAALQCGTQCGSCGPQLQRMLRTG